MKQRTALYALLAFALSCLVSSAATTYQFSSKSTGALTIEIAGDVVEEKSKSRVAIRKGDGFFLEDGDVILFHDGAKQINVLQPAKKTFYQLTPNELFQFTSGVVSAMRGFVAVEFGRPRTSARSFASPDIEGRKTRGVEIVSESDLRVKISGLTQKAKLSSISRWITTDAVATMASPFLRAQTIRTGMRELDDQLSGELQLVKGFPLRQTRRITTIIGKRSQTVETITEIHRLRTAATAPGSLFVVPEGFKRVEAPLGRVRKLLGQ